MARRLIEEWLPVAALGEESVRERRSMTALPPIYYLHVWWARRPLVASRAAVLASLLPADCNRAKFMHILGIHGDPVKAKILMDKARRTGNRVKDPYGYDRAFKYLPNEEEKKWIKEQLAHLDVDVANVLDPTAGGGSIPFETIRLGQYSLANDLNSVASIILKSTLETPSLFSKNLVNKYNEISKKWRERIEKKLMDYFPDNPNSDQVDTTYLYARTTRCPYCEGLIPLSPNWRLAPDGTGVRLKPNLETRTCDFEIVSKTQEQSPGTSKDGDAQCPYSDCERIISGEEIKKQAKDKHMGDQLFAIVYKKRVFTTTKAGRRREKWVRGYRAPIASDDNTDQISKKLDEKMLDWDIFDLIPNETIPLNTESWTHGNTPAQYDATKFTDLFNPRQLLCHGTSVEVFRELIKEEENKGQLDEVTKAAFVYLSFALDKLRDYDSRMTRWHSKRQVMVNTFDRHDF